MDNASKIGDQNENPVVQENQAQSRATIQPPMRVGTVSKEKGSNLTEFLRPAGQEVSPNPSEQEKESGVEVKSDRPDLAPEHKELGIEHAGPHVPVSTSPSNKVSLPMSEEEVASQFKTGQDDDSKTGLAKLVEKVMKALGV